LINVSNKTYIAACFLLGLFASLQTGCGSSDRSAVSGAITLDGKPLQTGTIELYPIESTKGPSSGGVVEGGRYQIPIEKGPMKSGTYQVRISSMQKSGKTTVDRDRPGEIVEWPVNIVPTRYNSLSTLKIKIEPNASESEFNFELQGVADAKAP
jgi:hypothetical protein